MRSEKTIVRRVEPLRLWLTLSLVMFHFTFTAAQIRIGGNVYGGGNQGEVKGSTKVTVLAGEIGAVDSAFARPLVNPKGKVFGGSRMANIGGNTYVHIDGEHFTKDNSTTPDYILINQVFGGNDIAGTIGTAAAVGETVPDELTGIKRTAEDAENPKKNVVDNTFNSYVRVSTKATGGVPDSDAKKVYIGQLFAGGNGDYDYKQTAGPKAGQVTHSIYYTTDKDHTTPVAQVVTNTEGVSFQLPELDKTYLEVVGGSIVYAYGGGNNATVKEKTIIHIDNPSKVVNHILVDATGVEANSSTYAAYESSETHEMPAGYEDLLSTTRFKEMGINTTFSQPSSGEYQVGRFFGGNNKAEMSIRPTWNLLAGKVRNLYSGGNSGNMTSPEGLLLEVPTYSTLEVENLYGGCRMADVVPTVNGEYTPCVNLPGYQFPNELSARTLVRGGHIINVYGGNDVTGTVYGGNAVGIYTQVYGNVYGGGNGAYPYTDLMEDDDTYGDFYYGDRIQGTQTSYEALNAFRPNAEQVSIRLAGTDKDHPTIVHGSIFVGGNCASLATKKKKPMVELKIGSHVIADNVFLGNNGEGMINEDYLKRYADIEFSNLSLTTPDAFAGYMEGVAMTLQPSIVFDSEANGDPATYEPYSSYVGSFYCGGNVGSMAIKGKETFTIDQGLNIFTKFVGGCNKADVPGTKLNAAYEGGLIGAKDERGSTETTFFTETGASDGKIKDRLEINMDNLTVVPLRWNDDNTKLIWNTHKWEEDDFVPIANEAVDANARLLGGNVYGGCYESGHVNGNVVININEDMLKRDEIFGTGTREDGRLKSGVNITNQSDDVLAVALTLFGAGYGKQTEIWGSTTVNHNNGYVFQIFGGGELGVVGKKVNVLDGHGEVTDHVYEFNPAYSTTVNLSGSATATSNDGAVENLAEAIYVYGGGNEGDVCGNTLVNLGNGRIYDAFGGASDADILGHAEVYIGRQPNGSGGYKDGFPWIRDIVYGGNDFGGTIHGEYEDGYDFEARLRNYATDKTQLHGYQDGQIPDVLQSSTYVEYLTGRVDTIFGGGYGYYDYSNTKLYGEGIGMPKQHSAFVNIRPKNHGQNALKAAFGGSTGYPGDRTGDEAQNRSYVLIDIPDDVTNFSNMEVFGAGSYNGIGMGQKKDELASGTLKLDEASSIVDLLRGRIHNAYGGSYNEGVTRRTVVNVPAQSSIQIDSIFGGAYGTRILPPCDVYETQVNYKNTSENAQVSGAIYGGNNNQRRSIFTQVNISSPVYSNKAKGYTGTVYGAGRGYNSWAEYTEVNLEKGARVYNVYGGAELGHVLNSASVQAYQNAYTSGPSEDIKNEDPYWKTADLASEVVLAKWQAAWKNAWSLGQYYTPDGDWIKYASNADTNLDHVSARPELDNKTAAQLDGQKKHNTNVLIKEGAVVEGYAYGGGLGSSSISGSGDVYGTTYIAVLGGEVKKDVYAGGRTGAIDNLFGVSDFAGHKFVATANAYIQGGTARNVYGGGYEGNVGYHAGRILADYATDRPALSYVVIGKKGTNTFVGGAPAITRNVYGGGEGGSLYGTSNVTLNNGYVGYRYDSTTKKYVEELNDQKPGDLDLSGNVFGGGYVINSYVDTTNIKMYGGTVRGSLFGGGEIGPIGRGSIRYTADGCLTNGDAHIRHAGMTNVTMYDGHVLRNVFGGGRGKDSWGGDGTMYMDPSLVATLDMKCKGFVFGQTRVNIHGGEIGTDEGMAHGYGNVFGGCDEGSVYSAYMDGSNLRIGKQDGERYDNNKDGYYYQWDGTAYLKADGEQLLTEDCKVVVEPHAQAYVPITINSHSYASGDYVPTSDLNTLKNKTADAAYWDNLDPDGIIIHNAVFAGGNLAAGSSSLFANATTVYGNATASIHDVYNRDLITIGTGHTGGLYGDGNLTFVDGYRELNITNYGTDYYHITKQLTYDAYEVLPEREKAYYELKYKCLKECTDKEGTTYKVDSKLPQDELLVLFEGTDKVLDGKPNPIYWQENGVVTVYAGRIMNTIQRADFCGVFGSRMVMKGAPDRVPEKADYTNYTINRVREVSLNKKESVAGDTDDNATHGNYFGIYSTVNYLGALTSDVKFNDVRTTNADISKTPDLEAKGETFYEWKSANIGNKKRNNGTCHNHLALASGVSLELTTEKSTGNTLTTKDWGPVTGVIELDLINVQPGMGGGFVYAKNIHGIPSSSNVKHTTLTLLNRDAASKKDYTYDTHDDAEHQHQWETSGNFIHSSQTIIDDCYNVSNRYYGTNKMPAHYWYIAGSVYVYDQYISAYTGSPNAYSETVEIPITISAAANGTMTLMDVQPNRYAYYSSVGTPLTAGQKLVIGDVTYQKNTPISYWDWQKLSAATRALFVKDTYVNTKAYKTSAESEEIIAANSQVELALPGGELYSVAEEKMVPASEIFHSSNNLSHDTGYLLTYNVTNPKIWDKWYTKVTNTTTGVVESNQTGGTGYEDGPIYHPTVDSLYGQKQYDVQAIISQNEYYKYNGYDANGNGSYTDDGDVYGLKQQYSAVSSLDDQATFVAAHIVTKEYDGGTQHYYPGSPVSSEISGYTVPAYVSTATIQLSPTEYIYVNDLMTEDQKNKYYNRFHKTGATPAEEAIAKDINELITPAYICTTAGLYGGSYYETDKNYRALEAYSAMSPADREKFDFNYDALDLLIDPAYGKKPDGTQQEQGKKYQYDGKPYDYVVTDANKADMIYSLPKPIDYTATYNGASSLSLPLDISVKRGVNTISTKELQQNDELFSTEFEKLPNEQRHYAAIAIKASNKDTICYVVKESFLLGDTPYAVGATISSATYTGLKDDKKNIAEITFPSADTDKTYYYCREEYQVGENGAGVKPTAVGTTGGIVTREGKDWVQVGTIINAISDGDEKGYNDLPNYQKNFTIHGVSPMETSTLYVARDADINDLSTEKIITVVYKYDYEESDKDGMHIVPVTERHVVNIHINFKSGVPMVEDINPPTIVLPGTGITMRIPTVTPGAYEITGGGWELFETKTNAESHVNGVPYTPSADPLYWYQDGFYLAYYAKTYLGKTYSNYVPVSVANYHDLKRVMDDKQYHLHVDYDRTRLKRDSKIYINDYSGSSENGLDLLKDLYDLSVSVLDGSPAAGYTVTDGKITAATGSANANLVDHSLLNTSTEEVTVEGSKIVRGVKGGKNLEFFLRTDINHPASWTPIGTDDQCFEGTLHGDGHTISGLNNSLFNNLCGEVYNLGVTGSFTSAGVADKGNGYVESAWINTTAPSGFPEGVRAVFGKPNADKDFKQLVNSYYQTGKSYSTTDDGKHGLATAMTDRAFYNGEVAFNLNNFYLYKRYNDHTVPGGSSTEYKYWKPGEAEPQTGKYDKREDLCSSGYNNLKYVENRFADGDFVFAAGEIPTWEDERAYMDAEDENKVKYFPIWPDDYLFFGQKLTYGWAAQAHQSLPSAIARSGGRLAEGEESNHVYRAPAYYRSMTMGVAYFNPDAYLAQKNTEGTKEAYPGMTAIDFNGHHDLAWNLGSDGGAAFYPPLLVDDGLTGIKNCDETRNLLVYAPAEAAVSGYANKKTYDVLNSTFTEPVYNSYYDGTNYRCVAQAPVASVQGHLVQNTLTATNDHLLVDMEDFNAPIAYHFDSDHLMWYQRTPANSEYVDRKKGWQGISVPFTAELVTTDRKGEITHFYSGSDNSQNGTKKGHEYWLREFTAVTEVTEKDKTVAKGTFLYPGADPSAANKTVTNSFLWDYYYKNETVHNQQDANADTYLQYRQYYKEPRSYTSYPMLAAAKPYILGLPGKTYYEFDLSGSFEAQNTAAHITKLGKQIITLASGKGIGIGVSDGEMAGVTQTESGSKSYTVTFKPSYMNEELESGNYVMNAEGNAYEKLTASKKLSAFRPYFTATVTGAGSRRMAPERIVFDGDNGEEFEESPETVLDGSIEIFVRGRSIVARSHRKEAATIRIVNVAGIVLNDFVIESGQTVETPVRIPGVYMANRKKLFVK
ncbi:hypothetical protein L6475_12195 [Prevotella sp. E9-3]|uniref:hypothetical protein n=1 Tax=Prevotella sp. E9-3 TaxID=2913621 RepID=UPI001EDC91A6|nr:hypothetical protein [Prevotella sp. E9-3]UKK47958.1 hypothetical protein L6475_12195 [Prevotella sp. E9-3]